MRCANPFWGAARGAERLVPFPCGQCLPCRINRRRIWTHRIMLEACQHTDNSFLTLTYREEELPRTKDGKYPDLSPRDLQLWLKRFRKVLSPLKVRFYAVGEYGEDQIERRSLISPGRPHYHVVLFGFKPCWRMGGTSTRNHQEGLPCCPSCDLVHQTWGKGRVQVLQFTRELSNYIAGYVTKKMTGSDDGRLFGRHPEFSRSSRNGGIGVGMVPEIASALLLHDLEHEEDVPVALRSGGKTMPLGSYLRRKLREQLGRSPLAPESVMAKVEAELSPLREVAWHNSQSVASAYQELWKGAVDRVETRFQIMNKRKKL